MPTNDEIRLIDVRGMKLQGKSTKVLSVGVLNNQNLDKHPTLRASLLLFGIIAVLLVSGCTQTDSSLNAPPSTTGKTIGTPPLSIAGSQASTPCTPDWSCTEWFDCMEPPPSSNLAGVRAKVCTDTNSCGNDFVIEGVLGEYKDYICNGADFCVKGKKMLSEECEYYVPMQSDLGKCSHMNPHFSCNVLDVSYCGGVYDKMNRIAGEWSNNYEIVGANGFVPSLISCRKGESVGESSDNIYCILWSCEQISGADGKIEGYGGLFGLGEYSYTYQRTNKENIYTYSLDSCAEATRTFSSSNACISYVTSALQSKAV